MRYMVIALFMFITGCSLNGLSSPEVAKACRKACEEVNCGAYSYNGFSDISQCNIYSCTGKLLNVYTQEDLKKFLLKSGGK